MPDIRPTPAATVSRTLNRLRARGPREVAALGAGRVQEWIASRSALIMFVRDVSPSEPAPMLPGLTFRQATAADANRYARDIGTDSANSFSRRLSERTRCFVIDDGRSLLHASWMTTAGAWTREVRAYLVPPPGDGYIYESFTRGEARGRGIYPFALRNLTTWGTSADIARLWVAVEELNTPSIRSVTKAGFVEAFRLPFARRFGRLLIDSPYGPRALEAAGFLSRRPPS